MFPRRHALPAVSGSDRGSDPPPDHRGPGLVRELKSTWFRPDQGADTHGSGWIDCYRDEVGAQRSAYGTSAVESSKIFKQAVENVEERDVSSTPFSSTSSAARRSAGGER